MKSVILKTLSVSVIVAAAFLSSCSEPKEVEKFTLIEKFVLTGEDSLKDQYTRTKGDAHSGSYFSRTDSTNQYGIGMATTVNDTNLNKDLRINVDLWCRANKLEPGYLFAIGVVDGDVMAQWIQLDVMKQIKQTNTWTNVRDSITIPGAQLNKPGLVIKAFAFNPNNADKSIVFDTDDLEITFRKVETVIEE